MSGLTITEKILAHHAGRDHVTPGEIVWADVDVLMTHDICGPGVIAVLQKELGSQAKVWDPNRIVIIPDHYIFTKDPDSNRNQKVLRKFVEEQGIPHFYEAGTDQYRGVCHVTLPEEGHTRPGELLLGTDSHTCTAGAFGLFATGIGNTDAAYVAATGRLWLKVPETTRVVFEGTLPKHLAAKDLILRLIGDLGVDGATYQTLEFTGEVVSAMSMSERMTLCNMAIECGAKSGIIAPDQTTFDFLQLRTKTDLEAIRNDGDASFLRELRYDVTNWSSQVARPHSPDNVCSIEEIIGTPIDRCYIGSCTGGKTEDFMRAAEILDGHEVRVPTFCIPATTHVAKDLERLRWNGRTLNEIFTAAGAQIAPPSCAACLGGPPDTVGRLQGEEVCMSTTNRNFPGRMGSPGSSVYLASPGAVAATALSGAIADPRNLQG